MSEGKVRWLDNDAPEAVLSFLRETDDEQMLVVVNTRNEAVTAEVGMAGSTFQSVVSAKATVAEGKAELGPYGFFVGRKK
jgi:glycosidase